MIHIVFRSQLLYLNKRNAELDTLNLNTVIIIRYRNECCISSISIITFIVLNTAREIIDSFIDIEISKSN
jgi:hypothetical protein